MGRTDTKAPDIARTRSTRARHPCTSMASGRVSVRVYSECSQVHCMTHVHRIVQVEQYEARLDVFRVEQARAGG
jgi:hypothetical protein